MNKPAESVTPRDAESVHPILEDDDRDPGPDVRSDDRTPTTIIDDDRARAAAAARAPVDDEPPADASTRAEAKIGVDPEVGEPDEVEGQPLPAPPDEPADVDPAADETGRPTILEMRQIAGLTSGPVMDLHAGSFQFRESDKEVGFSLVIRSAADVTVIPGTATVSVDEVVVDRPTVVGDAVLHVGTACFAVRPPRPEPTAERRLTELELGRRLPRAITVPDLESTTDAGSRGRSPRLGGRAGDDGPDTGDARSATFLESIRDTRSAVAERHRSLHPDPERLRSRVDRMDPGLWDRTADHTLFGRFAIAYGTIPWEPRFDAPERIPAPLHQPIRTMSCLPWVPITANLLFGPLGIVGSRPAVLAAARNAVLSLACLSSPSDIELSIVTAQGLIEDWAWTSALPNSLFPRGTGAFCVAVADGMDHFDGAGLDHDSVLRKEIGLIALGETADDVPDYCATVLEITADGRCRVANHLGEEIDATPIGVSATFAANLAADITAAVGDEPISELGPDGVASSTRPAAPPPQHRSAGTATDTDTDAVPEPAPADHTEADTDDEIEADPHDDLHDDRADDEEPVGGPVTADEFVDELSELFELEPDDEDD